ncbi:hypothetical protein [Planctomyces sp. SH-PL14]|uniref:hypothetical protein n=1 Tax=Planctomyces sp. SH-PL14 TaxID=1632864 RepID=UPI00078C3F86|nr:hypothetical protein [Planctomyces sp. SH-PL14]AMV21664.1 hypothetical protein VT03_27420 [Planctomyces sp. SH-PL14]
MERSFRGILAFLTVLSALVLAPPAPARAQAPPETPPAAAAEPKGVDRTIYLPFRDLWKVFEKQTATVVLPYQEYLDLKKRADAAPTEGQSLKAVITEANYAVKVEGDLARITVTLKINVLGKPWVELPLRFGDAAVGKVEGGEKVVLRGTETGAYSLMLGTAGEQTVKLELSTKIQTSPNGREIAIEAPPVGITNFEIAIPEEGQAIDVTPKVVTLPVEAAAGTTQFKASLGSTNRIAARWYPKASMKPEMDLLTSVDNRTKVTIDEGLVHHDAYLTYEILRGTISELRIAVPKSHRILDVASDAKLKGWQVKNDPSRQVITVELLSPREGRVQVEVHTESKLPADPFPVLGTTAEAAVNGIHPLDVVRESGQVAIRQSSDLTLAVVEQQGVTRIDAAELDDRLKGDGVVGFRYYNPQVTLRVQARPIEPRILVDHAASIAFVEDEVRVESVFRHVVDRAGVFQLQYRLPDELVVDAVEAPAMKEFSVDAATKTLTVALREKTQGAIDVTVRAHRNYAAGMEPAELALPIIEPLAVERETGTVRVYARESVEVLVNEKGLVSAQPVPLSGNAQLGDAKLNSTWAFTRRPVTIPVTTRRKATRISAEVATKATVKPELVDVETRLTYLVQYSGIDTFRLLTPAAVQDRIQIVAAPGSAVAIKQKTSGDAADGWVPWTIIMQREVTGPVSFLIQYDLKSAAGEAGAARSSKIELVRPLGYEKGDAKTPLSSVEGEMTVFKDDSLAVSADAAGGDVEAIDVRELQHLPQDGTLAFRYFDQPADAAIVVTLEHSKFDIQPVVPTIVSRSLAEIVIGEGQDATYCVQYQLKTSERQRLLVQLPLGPQLLGVYVGNSEVRLEKAEIGEKQKVGESWEPFWLNVIRKGRVEDEFVVTFHFQWGVNPSLGESRGGRGRLLLPLPVLGGAEARVPVQHQKVAVYAPRKYSLVGDPNPFQIERKRSLWDALFGRGPSAELDSHRESSFISSPAGQVSIPLPTEGRNVTVYSNLGGAESIRIAWWHNVTIAVVLSTVVAIVGLILIRTSWENKLTILLIALLVCSLYALNDPHTLYHVLAAARYGLAFLLLLWVVHALFALTRSGTTPPASPPPSTPPAPPPARDVPPGEPLPASAV